LIQQVWKFLNFHPMQLNVLTDGEVSDASRIFLNRTRDRSRLVAQQQSVGNANAQHKIRNSFTFAASSSDRTSSVSLGVNTPEAEVRCEPFRGNGIESSTRKVANLVQALPCILLSFQPFDFLRFRLFQHFRHGLSQKAKDPQAIGTGVWVFENPDLVS